MKKIKKTTLSTQLKDLYGKNYAEHIIENREYWCFFEITEDVYEVTGQNWNKICISYIRSGVAFYNISGYSSQIPEKYIPLDCFRASTLEFAIIDPEKDLIFTDSIDKNKKRYRFDDTRTTVINWSNEEYCYLDENEMDIFDYTLIQND